MVEWIPAHVGSGSGVLIGMMVSKEKVDMTDYMIERDPVNAYVGWADGVPQEGTTAYFVDPIQRLPHVL